MGRPTMECDGACGEMSTEWECEPPVVPVKIVGGRFDGWEFDYCQTAIGLDRDNGFRLERADRPKGGGDDE